MLDSPAVARGAERPSPNVVFILADDLGWRDSSVYGSTFYETPHLKRLARRGMTFTNAYSASPLCSPTRASILTGQYPGRLRLTTPAGHLPQEVLQPSLPERGRPNQKAVTPGTRTRLPNEYFTVAEALKQRGYTTGFFGKWHLGRAPYLPESQGFDEVIGGRHHPGPPGGYFAPWPIDTIPQPTPGEHISDRLAEEAVRFLKAQRDRPFFLCYWDYSVHAPFQAKEELIEKYRRKADPRNVQRNPVMAAMIEPLDDAVGRLLDALDDLDLAEDTIVIFTSDNGGNMYNVVEGLPPTNNAPLRNGKGSIYEGGVRVPLIVVWPGRVEAGSKSEAVVSSIDYYPTILEMLGMEPRTGQVLDGVSIVPALQQKGPLPREAIFCHFPHYIPATGNLPSTSVRRGDWKLIRFYADNDDQSDRFELYDLRNDIGERKNLAAAMPEQVGRLNALIKRNTEQTDPLVPFANPAYRPSVAGWFGNQHAAVSVEEGRLQIVSTGNDPFLQTGDVPSLSQPAVLEFRMKSTARGMGQVYWATSKQRNFHRDRSTLFEVTHDGAWHDYRVELAIGSPLSRLRIDPAQGSGRIAIEGLRLLEAKGKVVRQWPFE